MHQRMIFRNKVLNVWIYGYLTVTVHLISNKTNLSYEKAIY